VTVTAHRARRNRPARSARTRAALAAAALAVVMPAAACGFGAQTLRPYTPAEGVNFDVGDINDPNVVVHVRNLLIISRSPGEGIVSATMVTQGRDTLTAVTGAPYLADGSKGQSYTAELSGPVLLTANRQVVLTNQEPFITVSGATGLQAGLDTEITMQFGKAGSYTTRTTVVDGNLPPYTDVTPSASPSATPSVTAAPSPTP
jgi:hypothetical protein